jgi:DNA-binding transcriptional ArsR family regulator
VLDAAGGWSDPLDIIKILYKLSLMQQMDAAFAALADPTRRAILARLAKGEATVMELTEPLRSRSPRSRSI